MTLALALLSLALGTVYTSYGIITAVDLAKNSRDLGMSHFGVAWIAMAFTCGPHHFEHGLHLLAGDRGAGLVELVAVIVGVPAGVTWFLLRIEAVSGGRGDRDIHGTPAFVRALPALSVIYAVGFLASVVMIVRNVTFVPPTAASNVALVVLYGMIGWYLLRTQLASHRESGGWSLSGLSLTVVFPTCALMHAAWVAYQAAGRYETDIHSTLIDWLAVPAATYFLWVVRSLYSGTVRDWNEATTGAVPSRTATPEMVH